MESYSEIVLKEFDYVFYRISYFYTKYLSNCLCSFVYPKNWHKFLYCNDSHRVLLALALV